MAPPLVLWVLLAARATALSCVCTPSECEEVLEWECPGGGVVWDACGCCRVCARVEDEPCGGPDGFHGSCAPGLHCVLDPSQLLPQRAQRGEAKGTCKRVPGIIIGALSEDGRKGSEDGRKALCPEGTTQDSVFGCDIVGRVCRCSSLPACTSMGGVVGEREKRSSRLGRTRAGYGTTKRRMKRRKRDNMNTEEVASKNPYTFSTLEECEMNLAEVLRQEEVPPSTVSGFVSSSGVNCTVVGCETTGIFRSGMRLSSVADPCPEGSARVDGSSGSVGGSATGPCLCLPSLCPTAYLPFSCPFGARVLRRASRIPGDCCDQYECASPPPDFRELVAEAAKEDEEAASNTNTGGRQEKIEGAREPEQKKYLCPKGIEKSNKTVIGCDIVGKVCRCTRLPTCSSGGTRSRKRRKKGSGRGSWTDGGDLMEEWAEMNEKRNDVTRSPFTFLTLDECKDKLAELLRKDEATYGEDVEKFGRSEDKDYISEEIASSDEKGRYSLFESSGSPIQHDSPSFRGE